VGWTRTYQVQLVVTRCLKRVARATIQNQVCRSSGVVNCEGIEACGIGLVQAASVVAALYGLQQMLQSSATVSSAGSDSPDGNGMLQGIGLTLESITKRLQQANGKLSQASPSTEASLLPDAPQEG
jgi:hypothetical protein